MTQCLKEEVKVNKDTEMKSDKQRLRTKEKSQESFEIIRMKCWKLAEFQLPYYIS
jgi:hypothetical protein